MLYLFAGILIAIGLIVRFIYRSDGYYQVLIKVKYKDLPNDNKWVSHYSGSYVECSRYVRHAKNNNTELLGFKESYKIQKM